MGWNDWWNPQPQQDFYGPTNEELGYVPPPQPNIFENIWSSFSQSPHLQNAQSQFQSALAPDQEDPDSAWQAIQNMGLGAFRGMQEVGKAGGEALGILPAIETSEDIITAPYNQLGYLAESWRSGQAPVMKPGASMLETLTGSGLQNVPPAGQIAREGLQSLGSLAFGGASLPEASTIAQGNANFGGLDPAVEAKLRESNPLTFGFEDAAAPAMDIALQLGLDPSGPGMAMAGGNPLLAKILGGLNLPSDVMDVVDTSGQAIDVGQEKGFTSPEGIRALSTFAGTAALTGADIVPDMLGISSEDISGTWNPNTQMSPEAGAAINPFGDVPPPVDPREAIQESSKNALEQKIQGLEGLGYGSNTIGGLNIEDVNNILSAGTQRANFESDPIKRIMSDYGVDRAFAEEIYAKENPETAPAPDPFASMTPAELSEFDAISEILGGPANPNRPPRTSFDWMNKEYVGPVERFPWVNNEESLSEYIGPERRQTPREEEGLANVPPLIERIPENETPVIRQTPTGRTVRNFSDLVGKDLSPENLKKLTYTEMPGQEGISTEVRQSEDAKFQEELDAANRRNAEIKDRKRQSDDVEERLYGTRSHGTKGITPEQTPDPRENLQLAVDEVKEKYGKNWKKELTPEEKSKINTLQMALKVPESQESTSQPYKEAYEKGEIPEHYTEDLKRKEEALKKGKEDVKAKVKAFGGPPISVKSIEPEIVPPKQDVENIVSENPERYPELATSLFKPTPSMDLIKKLRAQNPGMSLKEARDRVVIDIESNQSDTVSSVIEDASKELGITGEKFAGFLDPNAPQTGQRRGNNQEGNILLNKAKALQNAKDKGLSSLEQADTAIELMNAIEHELAHRNISGHGKDFDAELGRVKAALGKHRGKFVSRLIKDNASPAQAQAQASISPAQTIQKKLQGSLKNYVPPPKQLTAQSLMGTPLKSVPPPSTPPIKPPKITKPKSPKVPPIQLNTLGRFERAAYISERNIEKASPQISAAEKGYREYHERESSKNIGNFREAIQGMKGSEKKIISRLNGNTVNLTGKEATAANIIDNIIGNVSGSGTRPKFNSFSEVETHIDSKVRDIAKNRFLKGLRFQSDNTPKGKATRAYVKNYINQIQGNVQSGEFAKAASKLRQAVALGNLQLTQILQTGQSVHTTSYVGFRRSIRAAFKAIGSYKKEELQAVKDGALWPTMSHEVGAALGSTGYMHGTPTVDKALRVHANIAGKMLLEDAKKGEKYANRILKDLGLTVNSLPAAVSKAVSDKTQFRTDISHLPSWAHTTPGRMVWQYSQFAYAHTKFMYEMIKGGPKNSGQIFRMALLAATVGEGIADLRTAIRALVPGDDEEDDLKRRQLEAWAGDEKLSDKKLSEKIKAVMRNDRIPWSSPGWRIMQNMSMIGGAGIFQSILEKAMNAKGPIDLLKLSVGPAATQAVELFGAGMKDVEKGQFREVPKELLKKVPLPFWPGSKIANKVYPPKKSGGRAMFDRF